MTNDERHEDESGTADSSSGGGRDASQSAHDVTSPADRVKRWSDPESRWGNPEKDLPNIPYVDVPGQEDDESLKSEFSDDAPEFTVDIDPEQSRLFWASVVLANVGLAAISIGPMLIYFRGQLLVGGGVTLLGMASLARVYTMYQEYETRDWSTDDEDTSSDDGGASTADGDGHDTADDDTATGVDTSSGFDSSAERNR